MTEVRDGLIEEKKKNSEATRRFAPGSVTEGDTDNDMQRAKAICKGLGIKAGFEVDFRDNDEENLARRISRCSAMDGLRFFINQTGGDTRDLDTPEILSMAYEHGSVRTANSTGLFPIAMSDFINLQLLKGYQGPKRNFEPLCRFVSASDFRDIDMGRWQEDHILDWLPEGAKIETKGTILEGGTSFKLKRMGGGITLTMQAMRNDRLGQLYNQARDIIRALIRMEREVIIQPLINNTAQYVDYSGKKRIARPFFHADFKNTLSAVTLDKAAYKAAEKALYRQYSLNPKDGVMGQDPRFLIVPKSYEEEAEALFWKKQYPAKTEDVKSFVLADYEIQILVFQELETHILEGNQPVFFVTADPREEDLILVANLDGERNLRVTKQEITAEGDLVMKYLGTLGAGHVSPKGFIRTELTEPQAV